MVNKSSNLFFASMQYCRVTNIIAMNYFIVFVIDYASKDGKLMAKRLETYEAREMIRGFETKSKMKQWANENAGCFRYFTMLKPIS